MSLVGNVPLGSQDTNYGTYLFPASIYFSPGGNLLYVQAPPSDFTGGGLPFLVYNPQSLAPLPTAPIPVTNATFLYGVADPQPSFTYVGNSAPTNGISVYQVDLSTGLPSQPSPISSPFFQPTSISPLFVTVEQNGQGIQAPTLGTSPAAISFSSTTTGRSSGPQKIVLKSLGTQSVTLSSLQISGANASEFTETDNCLSSPVLPNNHSCTISVTYSPTVVGSSQAILFIADNAAGSPQSIALTGTSITPAPGAPSVSLNPASTLTFPGTPTQGTFTSPQSITVTNSGNVSLQILSAVLSGFNASDFSISSDTCSGSVAANASCTIALVFSPIASGIRTTTLTLTDSAANSPQSLSISGTAAPAATIASPTGSSTTASVTAGQTAKFNLQVIPGVGFTGTLSFTCSGAPFGATCTVPSALSVTNGSPVSFTVSISTLGASQLTPTLALPPSLTRPTPTLYFLAFFAALCALLLVIPSRRHLPPPARVISTAIATVLSLFLVASGVGCGGGAGGSSATQSSPSASTVAAPSIQPTGGTFTAPQSVSITDSTAGATIYFTTDGSTPSASSSVYSAPFSLSSATNVQAMAAADGYNNSSSTSANFKFRTPAATYPITINVTATAAGSSKLLQLNPIALTLIVQ
ncbi:MAG TPA: choice-of-anchor D domain-containing protein [Verrucomicrobiae bacterium]|nr:choice-of-anchor D domain-containing protein [Verrucomicrobiae bacterium]